MKVRAFVAGLSLAVLFCARAFAESGSWTDRPVVTIGGGRYLVHTVTAGETLYGLSVRYNVPQSALAELNGLKGGVLQAGQALKVPVPAPRPERLSRRKLMRTFVEHTVVSGETIYSIGRNYSVPLSVLLQDNPGLDPVQLVPGQVLRIRRRNIGDSSAEEIRRQIADYVEALDSVDPVFGYHFVEGGETLYSLGRAYDVPQDTLAAYNSLSRGLRTGMILRIPVPERVPVEPVDSLHTDDSSAASLDYPLKDYRYDGDLRIAMLLPLSERGVPKESFADFYQGALLALEDYKAAGYSLTLDLYDTERSSDRVREIVGDYGFRKADAVVGPVYEDNAALVAEWGRRRGVPVVSPLALVEGEYGHGFYQLAPDAAAKYDKLEGEFRVGRKIVLFTTQVTDEEFDKEMRDLIGDLPYDRIVYAKERTAAQIDTILAANKDNLFVVVSGEEVGVDMILAAISSVQNNRLARTLPCGSVKVIGSSRWTRYRNLEKNLFFKLGVSLVTSYHADRSDERVADFDRRYIAAFGRVPTLYSYRGYDAVGLLAGAMLEEDGPLTERLDAREAPLQTPYRFVSVPGGNTVNRQWVLVDYRKDYTISVR